MFRVIDTETTSLEGKVVEIASVDVDVIEETISNAQSDMVNPLEWISVESMATHHITDAMVQDKPTIDQVIGKYLGADFYVAHNASFDKKMLPEIPDDAVWICTLKLSRYFYPDLPKHTNQYMRYALQLNVDVPEGLYPHRALYDCYVTAALLIHFGTICGCGIEGMLQITNEPLLLNTINFGKHKGKLWSEIDYGFLNWCIKNMKDMDEDTRYTVEYYLKK